MRRRGSSGKVEFGSVETIFLLLGETGEQSLESVPAGPRLLACVRSQLRKCFLSCEAVVSAFLLTLATWAPSRLCVTVEPERAERSRALVDSHQMGLSVALHF